MSRFYSKHQINKTENQLNEENLLDTLKYKHDLRSALNNENHRVNIDSAKKKAVMQRMDYDGFHQMVLGADLKGIKSKEMLNLKSNDTIVNNVMIQRKLNEEIDPSKGNFVIADIKKNFTQNLNQTEKNFDQENLKEFYKNFKKNWKAKQKPIEKISMLFKLNEYEVFASMISIEMMEADIFLDYIFNMGCFILSEEYLALDSDRKMFLINCLKAIVDSQYFLSLHKFLGKKQKQIYKEINEKKNEILTEECSAVLELFIDKLI
jgi:hypothetical protein